LTAETEAKRRKETDCEALAEQLMVYRTNVMELKNREKELEFQLQDMTESQSRSQGRYNEGISRMKKEADWERDRALQALQEASHAANTRREMEITRIAKKYEESTAQIQHLEAQLKAEKEGKHEGRSDSDTLFPQLAAYRAKHG
jgi:chromosome segregation ATPase